MSRVISWLSSKKYWKKCYLKSASDIPKRKYCNCKMKNIFLHNIPWRQPKISGQLSVNIEIKNKSVVFSFFSVVCWSVLTTRFFLSKDKGLTRPWAPIWGGGVSKRLSWIVENARRTNRGWRQNLSKQIMHEYLLTNVPADNYSLNRN